MILVTGATGSIGRPLVRRLRASGVAFRALVRDEARGRALGCDVVVGDLDDPASIAAALRGVDQLFLNGAGAGPVDGEQPMVRQQTDAIDAARAAGVERVVKISVWHAHEGGRLAEGAHWEIEQHLKVSGLRWTVLQPNGFMQNFLTGAGSFTADRELIGAYGDARVSYIDCEDIAACAARILTRPRGQDEPGNETFILTGPQALTHSQIAERLSAAIGRTIRYRDLPPPEFAATLRAQGLPAAFADDVAALHAEVAAGSLAATASAVADLTGRAPRTFDDFLAAHRDDLRALGRARSVE
ncbi:putative nucleoside-diphosphate sugar epimerase [Frankia canadensis]|uniref:Putative nucleoside-diphosphate sugar epimerase n=1 Tax=Frankia canadensis TaxID=1836972 RepID=A0A2I2KQH2_9ACTN|nr:SDR family oxidoreductase [Frankia canadensis]SNQ47900.1 putative nucleoside-diphosphate sugar epimerase [Frankia canadensis]SOU55190.1 putative nucleoside-diphosphate sugar epimerase [Frankia canadensis]